jgi:hypothetical protein
MSELTTEQFILEVLQLTAMFPNDLCSELMWRCDREYAPITFFINCSDLFYWGCADGETVTKENIHILRESIKDLAPYALSRQDASLLFCCRVRKMRPQGAYYKYIDKEVWHLYDEAGPEREIGNGNTPKPE